MTSGIKPDTGPWNLLAAELGRLTDHYRRMPHAKFRQRLDPYGDRASAGAWLANQLAAVAQGAEEHGRVTPPVWRRVPSLGDFALGDQIAVTGGDVLAAFDALGTLDDPAAVQVWTLRDGRMDADKALAAVLASTTALREAL